VHVGQSDIPARLVRQMIGPDKILGISVKTPAEAAKAQVRALAVKC
jgi:thiamine monophosphate synthase